MKRLLVLSLFVALSAFGADVAGKWKATYNGQDGPRDVTFTFEMNDGKLTGTAAGTQGSAPLTGKVEGDNVSFTVESDNFKAVLTGTLSGDKMKLHATVGERSFDLLCDRL